MSLQKTAVIILNWNGKVFLEKFLPAVVKYSSGIAEIIIADNSSKDDSINFLETNFPEVRIIEFKENFGFSKGYNEALKNVTADYFVLLNTDIEVTENWLQPVIKMMENDKNIGACQPKLLSYNDKKKFEYAGGAGGYIDKFGYPFCRGRIFQNIEEDKSQYNDAVEIFWATGACMFVRADLFRVIGGLDDDFFAHMEEIDFCWRLKNAGYKIMYCPDSVVYHVGGGTLPKNNSRKTYLNFRNNLSLLYKNLPENKFHRIFLLRFILDGIAAFRFLAEGHILDFIAVAKAHFSFYFSIRKLDKKRKLMSHRKVSCIYQRNIVWDYFVNKIKLFTQLNSSDFSK
ncbi:MAG: glycosyltransferase family 2 protein [Bacteroidales bacterium]|jgi:hypothetical protein